MKTVNIEAQEAGRLCAVTLILLGCTLLGNDCPAQIQQAWVARYNNGITNGTNQAVKMVLDSSGNIYVTGISQNANTNLGYVTIKYASNGNQVWVTRYDSTNFPSATPVALAVDSSNNVFVTGNAWTVKYDPNGNQLWTAPYAGSALAVDSAGNAVVTGISTTFGTVKLSPAGSNLWTAYYPPAYLTSGSQAVVIDSNNNIYVSGTNVFGREGDPDEWVYQIEILTIKYGSNGNQLWTSGFNTGYATVQSTTLDGVNNVYILANGPGNVGYTMLKYNASGSNIWTASLDLNGGVAHGLAVDIAQDVFVTGQMPYAFSGTYSYYYDSYKLNSDGSFGWTNYYPYPGFETSVASAVAVDSAKNSYVTGYSPGINSENDVVTIKYGPNGNQIWLQRYNGPGNGNDAGNAIAVDQSGNVYVAGYDTTTAGGTEMVLIKYSPLTMQKKTDGSILLQAQGSPGESFDIQASTNLLNWLDLGTVIADTNGLMQYADTNASNFPSRFYITNPQ